EASAYGLEHLWWIIDFNRQSLDRIVPDHLAGQIRRQFEAKDWQVLELRYGMQQETFFRRPNGHLLKEWLDTCPNSLYQSLMSCQGAEIRHVLSQWGDDRGVDMRGLLAELDEPHLKRLLFNVGGHDMQQILRTLSRAAQMRGPLMILAYTTKGWGLPMAGHLENHAALLTDAQLADLQAEHDIAVGAEWDDFADGVEAEWMKRRSEERGFSPRNDKQQAYASPISATGLCIALPDHLALRYPSVTSTQAAFGQMLTALSDLPQLGDRMVTLSPDVAVSTSLGAWINRRGVYAPSERPNDWQAHAVETLLQWNESPKGQHIELGIAEHNFYLALAMFGLAPEMQDQMLWPIGTIYDPFVGRGLDALKYGAYAHSKFIFAGTPSGLTLCREAGAHQSFLTPLLGIGMPNLVAYEPAYAAELEVMLCWALQQLVDREHGESVYFRLSTKTLRQEAEVRSPTWRQQVLAGGYWLRDYRQRPDYHAKPQVHIMASGVLLAEALAASEMALEDDIYANVINITSPDRLFRDWMAQCRGATSDLYLDTLLPAGDRQTPAVSLLDGHPLALAWLGNVLHAPMRSLGVTDFGESAALADLYHKHQIDADAVLGAMTSLLFG
ncbi:MAG: hypothetical protein O7G88_03170, partial [bacterium]|nr:hypothetical protein [bacterium]